MTDCTCDPRYANGRYPAEDPCGHGAVCDGCPVHCPDPDDDPEAYRRWSVCGDFVATKADAEAVYAAMLAQMEDVAVPSLDLMEEETLSADECEDLELDSTLRPRPGAGRPTWGPAVDASALAQFLNELALLMEAAIRLNTGRAVLRLGAGEDGFTDDHVTVRWTVFRDHFHNGRTMEEAGR